MFETVSGRRLRCCCLLVGDLLFPLCRWKIPPIVDDSVIVVPGRILIRGKGVTGDCFGCPSPLLPPRNLILDMGLPCWPCLALLFVVFEEIELESMKLLALSSSRLGHPPLLHPFSRSLGLLGPTKANWVYSCAVAALRALPMLLFASILAGR